MDRPPSVGGGGTSDGGRGLRTLGSVQEEGGGEGCWMSTAAKRRLLRDFKRLQNDPTSGVTGAPDEDNILDWSAVIFGPDDTPWEGATLKLKLVFTEEYPNKPPKVEFVSKMFHPNVYTNGAICLDILQNQWSPIYDIAAILTSIQSLLTDPNPNSPANVEAARLYQENRREYDRRVLEIVEASWEDDGDDGIDLEQEEDEEEEDEKDEEKETQASS